MLLKRLQLRALSFSLYRLHSSHSSQHQLGLAVFVAIHQDAASTTVFSRIHRSCTGVKASFKVGLKEGMSHSPLIPF